MRAQTVRAIGLWSGATWSLLVLLPGCTSSAPVQAGSDAPTTLHARAEDLRKTVVTPHLEERITGKQNVLWCSTFQLVWNEMCGVMKGDIRMDDAPPMVAVLNKHAARKEDIDEASYVAMAGFVQDGILDKINKAVDEKFKGRVKTDLMPDRKSVGPGYLVAYACLLKDLPFEHPFDRSPCPMKFMDANVATFGIEAPEDPPDANSLPATVPAADSGAQPKPRPVPTPKPRPTPQPGSATGPAAEGGPAGTTVEPVKLVFEEEKDRQERHQRKAKVCAQVLIYDYKEPNDFIVELKTKARDDRLILARIQPGDTLATTIATVHRRVGASKPQKMRGEDMLMVPIFAFDITRRYKELIGRNIGGPGADFPVIEAIQDIRFKLDEKGAELISSASGGAGGGPEHPMIFDGPFLILLQRDRAKAPYFALWVANAELLVPMADPPPPPEMTPDPTTSPTPQ